MAARAELEITASDSKLGAGLARARAKVNEWASSIARGTSQAMSKVWSGMNKDVGHLKAGDTMKHAVGVFGGNMMTKGVESLADAATSVRDFERSLVRYQIVANKSPESMKDFRNQVRQVSKDTGIASSVVLEGAQAYLDLTGDVEGTSKQMATFARVAQSSDAAMADVSTAAASMQDAMNVSPGEMEATFSGLINQGKAGAVTLKNMAGEFPMLLSKFARFGKLGKEGTLELGAMFQVARKGFGSAEEAGTGMAAMMAGMIKHADRFQKAGVEVFNVGKDGTKTLKPMSEILEQIGKSKLAKDPQLLNKAFGRGEGEQAYQMLSRHVDMLKQMEEAGRDAGTVQRDMMTYTSSAAGRIDLTMNKLKETLSQVFTPERIERFAGVLERAVATVDRLVQRFEQVSKWIDENSGDSADEQRAKIAQQSAGKSAAWKEQAASDLDAQADELAPVMGMQNIADSWLGRIAHAGGAMPDASAFEAGNGAVQRQSAIRLRRSAGIQREDANRDAMYNDSTSDSWAGRNFAEKPTLAGAGFAPADTGKFLSDLKSTIVDAMQAAKGPTVKIGDNQVATSAAKSTKARAVTP